MLGSISATSLFASVILVYRTIYISAFHVYTVGRSNGDCWIAGIGRIASRTPSISLLPGEQRVIVKGECDHESNLQLFEFIMHICRLWLLIEELALIFYGETYAEILWKHIWLWIRFSKYSHQHGFDFGIET